MSWIVQAVGVFYVLAGIVVLRQMALERLLDQALAAITMRPASAVDRRETQLLSLGGYLTFASGLSALTLSRWSVALFAVASLAQALYLVWAARATPPQDELERKGRRATINAFLIYLAASAFVIYAAWHGAVRPWPFLDPGFATALAELGAILAVTLAIAWYFRRKSNLTGGSIYSRRDEPDTESPAVDDEHERPEYPKPPKPPKPRHLRLAPEYHCWPTWDDENGNVIDPADLGLSQALVDRINAWDARFQETYCEDDPYHSRFADVADERQWVRDGGAIAADLAREWPGPINVWISGLEMTLQRVGGDLEPGESIPEARAGEIGRDCGVAEIEDIISRLDALARRADALTDRDVDARENAAREQNLFARILSTVPIRYTDDIRRGLESPEAQTRTWVTRALEWRQDGDGS